MDWVQTNPFTIGSANTLLKIEGVQKLTLADMSQQVELWDQEDEWEVHEIDRYIKGYVFDTFPEILRSLADNIVWYKHATVFEVADPGKKNKVNAAELYR